MTTAKPQTLEDAKLQFVLSVDRLLKQAEQARQDRDRLLEIVEQQSNREASANA